MNATSIFVGLLIVLFMILLHRWMRKRNHWLWGLDHKGCAHAKQKLRL